MDILPDSEMHHLRHELRQPLNVIRLAAASIGRRLADALPAEDAEFLARKLERIEQQVARADAIIDQGPACGHSEAP